MNCRVYQNWHKRPHSWHSILHIVRNQKRLYLNEQQQLLLN